VVGNDNAGACPNGSVNQVTPPMMHVWMTPGAGGALAPESSDVSEVDSARAVAVLNPANATA
jgi:hypothetical protein